MSWSRTILRLPFSRIFSSTELRIILARRRQNTASGAALCCSRGNVATHSLKTMTFLVWPKR
jgi:hypothetical protein